MSLNGSFCADCNVSLNSRQQWDHHVRGAKHLRAAALRHSKANSNTGEMDLVTSQLHNLSLDITTAIFDKETNYYTCKYCTDFFCTGPEPMRAHLIGKRHLKAVEQQAHLSSSATSVPSLSSLLHNEHGEDGSPAAKLSKPGSPLHAESGTDNSSPAINLGFDIFGCKLCPGFKASGTIPLNAHFAGKKHRKNAERMGCMTDSRLSISSAPSTPVRSIAAKDIRPKEIVMPCVDAQTRSTSIKELLESKNLQRSGDNKTDNSPKKLSSVSRSFNCENISPDKRVELAWNHDVRCGFMLDTPSAMSPEGDNEILIPHFAYVTKDEAIPNLGQYLMI